MLESWLLTPALMTRWLCRVRPEELSGLREQTAEALALGIQGWLLPVQQDTVPLLLDLFGDWPAEMQLGLELLEPDSPPDLLQQALSHRAMVRFQGRPMFVVREQGVVPAGVITQVVVFGPRSSEGFCGVADWIPLGDPDGRLNYEWFLKQAHYRGSHPELLLPAVRALTPDQMDGYVAADSQRYQAWLKLESAWSTLQGDGVDATVLIDSWAGHQRWWSREQPACGTAFHPQQPWQGVVLNRYWGVMQPKHLAIAIHGFYLDRLASILEQLPPGGDRDGWPPLDLYVSTPRHQLIEAAECIRRLKWPRVRLFGVPNRGRDFAPFVLEILPEIMKTGHRFVLKLHTKASLHMQFGHAWGELMLTSLLRPRVFDQFANSDEIGVLTPPGALLPMSLNLADNVAGLHQLKALTLSPLPPLLDCYFPGGSMFLARTDALQPLLDLRLRLDDFDQEAGQLDGTLSHALERWVGVAAQLRGYRQDQVPGDERLVPDFGFRRALRIKPEVMLNEG